MANSFLLKISHYFLPHESNNYKAKALHNKAVIFYIVLLLFVQFSFSLLKWARLDVLGYATDISVEKILVLVNEKRREANLEPLTLSNDLAQAATAKGNDMFTQNYWAHVSPTGTTPWAFITATGYEYVYAGENLARNFDKSGEVVEAWMSSPTHKANILKPEYKDIGLAVINGRLDGEDTTLVVQEFGTPSRGVQAQVLPTFAPSQPEVLDLRVSFAGEIAKSRQSLLFPKLSKSFSIIVAEFLLMVIFIDSIYLWKFKTHRLGGHGLAHIIFIVALLGAMGATGIGVIL